MALVQFITPTSGEAHHIVCGVCLHHIVVNMSMVGTPMGATLALFQSLTPTYGEAHHVVACMCWFHVVGTTIWWYLWRGPPCTGQGALRRTCLAEASWEIRGTACWRLVDLGIRL